MNMRSLIVILCLVGLCYGAASPPSIGSYTLKYSKTESGEPKISGTEYYSASTNQFHVVEGGSIEIIQQGSTDVGIYPDGTCYTYCAHNQVCPPNPAITCSSGHQSFFTELVNATHQGSCTGGLLKWVSIGDQGTGNEYSSTFCISSAGVPHSLVQEFTSDHDVFFDATFSNFVAGEPAASLFVIPTSCECVYSD